MSISFDRGTDLGEKKVDGQNSTNIYPECVSSELHKNILKDYFGEDESKDNNLNEPVEKVSEKNSDVTEKDKKQSEKAYINSLKQKIEEELAKLKVRKQQLEKAIKENEQRLYKQQGKMANKVYDKSLAEPTIDNEGNASKEFNLGEKVVLSNATKRQINNVPKGLRGNYRVPEPEKIKGVRVDPEGNARIVENWKPNSDGAKSGTRHMEIVRAVGEDGKPTLIDRIGAENGNYFSPMNPEGEPYSLKERGIGDYLPEKDIQENDSYHLYKVLKDFTRENFEKAIEETYQGDRRNEQMDRLYDYYKVATKKSLKDGHPDEKYCNCSVDDADGVKTGEIDQMFLKDGDEYGKGTDGGGMQYITPFSVDELKKMKMIEEI